MLKSLKVRAFKSLEDIEVDLGLVNVFIGANGSGKSNLLEALGVLGAAANGRVDDEALLRRGVRPGLPALYKSSFKASRQPPAIQLSGISDRALYSVGLLNPLNNPRPSWWFKTERLEEDGRRLVGRGPASYDRLDKAAGYAALKAVELPENSPAGELLAELQQFAIYTPDTPTLRGLRIDAQSRAPVGLNGGGLAEGYSSLRRSWQEKRMPFRDFIRDLFPLIDWARAIGVSSASDVPVSKTIPQPSRILSFKDRFMVEGRNSLSGYDASEGALYVLFMSILVHHPDSPPILAVDNFDHALNPRLAKALTRQICEWTMARSNRQLLLTSHNPLVLDGLPLRSEQVRLFTVERSRQGKTIVSRVLVDESLLRYAEDGIPLSQQWVMGTFGGIPQNV